MLLSVYAEEHNLVERKAVKVIKVMKSGKDFTIHYRISGQKYRDQNDVSKRTVSAALYSTLEVDDDGNLISGNVVKKSNFLVWEPDESDEA